MPTFTIELTFLQVTQLEIAKQACLFSGEVIIRPSGRNEYLADFHIPEDYQTAQRILGEL